MTSDLSQRISEALGLLGVALYLGSYALLQFGVLRGSGYTYTLMNLAAAICVLISLSVNFNLYSALIQISWIVISVVGLTLHVLRNHRARFTAEEQDLLATQFPDMPRPMARKFLDLGTWSDGYPGEVLTREGEPVKHLFYIASGQAEVWSAGVRFGVFTRELVGELGVLGGNPASATVRLSDPARLFSVPAGALLAMTRRDPEFKLILLAGMGRDTGRKLIRANRQSTVRSTGAVPDRL